MPALKNCTGPGCQLCEGGNKALLRVAFNFFCMADKTMKIIECGTRWFGDVLRLRGKYGFDNWAFEIERRGAAGNPKTTYSILPENKLDAATKEVIAGLALHDLDRETVAVAKAACQDDTGEAAAVVSGEIARALHAQLVHLSQNDTAAFFRRFGIERVSQLRAVDQAAAQGFLSERQGLPF